MRSGGDFCNETVARSSQSSSVTNRVETDAISNSPVRVSSRLPIRGAHARSTERPFPQCVTTELTEITPISIFLCVLFVYWTFHPCVSSPRLATVLIRLCSSSRTDTSSSSLFLYLLSLDQFTDTRTKFAERYDNLSLLINATFIGCGLYRSISVI